VHAVTKNGAGQEAAEESPVTWRELAVARSLDSARTRAENRVQRFLDAAVELMGDNDSNEFTVQEVVERSGQSLRSFYQYFGGKHELLLALFEESVRSTAEQLAGLIDEEDDPLERLHRFVVEYYVISRVRPRARKAKSDRAPVMVEFAQQLLTSHPADAARAFVPLVRLFEQALADAEAAGVLRPGLNRRSIAGTLLEVIAFNAFSATIGGSPLSRDPREGAEELWDLVFRGIGADEHR
jgi:AcrR family transcriptional regulator